MTEVMHNKWGTMFAKFPVFVQGMPDLIHIHKDPETERCAAYINGQFFAAANTELELMKVLFKGLVGVGFLDFSSWVGWKPVEKEVDVHPASPRVVQERAEAMAKVT